MKITSSILLIGVLAALVVFEASCGNSSPRADDSPRSAPVSVAVVAARRTPFPDVYEAAGTIKAEERAVIASKVTGYIIQISVKAGDSVNAGQPLIEIESALLKTQVSAAQATLATAENAVVEAEKNQESAAAEEHLASLTYQRFKQLLDKQSVSPHEFDQMEARQRSASATREMAAARLQEAHARQDEAKATLDSALVRLGDARIAAPFAGIVTEKPLDAGTLATVGMPLLTIEKASGYRLEAAVPESRMANVKIGDAVSVAIPATHLQTTGHIVEIAPSADVSTRSYLVKISLQPGLPVHTGMFGRALLSHGSVSVLAVPSQVIVRNGQLSSVSVVSDGIAHRRLITLGRSYGESVEVLSGLEQGEQIVASGPATLMDGAPVEVRR